MATVKKAVKKTTPKKVDKPVKKSVTKKPKIAKTVKAPVKKAVAKTKPKAKAVKVKTKTPAVKKPSKKQLEQEKLIQTLKFTPRNYRVEITGYGGEVYWSRVDRKIYDLFKEKKIDIEQYAGGWDDDMFADIPDDMRPFPPGAPYDLSGTHESGATFSDDSYITVYDENGDEVWSSALGPNLENAGVEVDHTGDETIDDLEPGTVVFWGGQGEKGLFFGNEFKLTAPFDHTKLRVGYYSVDGWDLVMGVSYDGEDIDSNDYDTTGKWAENKWIIVGDTEEVYEGEEREEGESYSDEEDED